MIEFFFMLLRLVPLVLAGSSLLLASLGRLSHPRAYVAVELSLTLLVAATALSGACDPGGILAYAALWAVSSALAHLLMTCVARPHAHETVLVLATQLIVMAYVPARSACRTAVTAGGDPTLAGLSASCIVALAVAGAYGMALLAAWDSFRRDGREGAFMGMVDCCASGPVADALLFAVPAALVLLSALEVPPIRAFGVALDWEDVAWPVVLAIVALRAAFPGEETYRRMPFGERATDCLAMAVPCASFALAGHLSAAFALMCATALVMHRGGASVRRIALCYLVTTGAATLARVVTSGNALARLAEASADPLGVGTRALLGLGELPPLGMGMAGHASLSPGAGCAELVVAAYGIPGLLAICAAIASLGISAMRATRESSGNMDIALGGFLACHASCSLHALAGLRYQGGGAAAAPEAFGSWCLALFVALAVSVLTDKADDVACEGFLRERGGLDADGARRDGRSPS